MNLISSLAENNHCTLTHSSKYRVDVSFKHINTVVAYFAAFI